MSLYRNLKICASVFLGSQGVALLSHLPLQHLATPSEPDVPETLELPRVLMGSVPWVNPSGENSSILQGWHSQV